MTATLPDELLLEIFSYGTPPDWLACRGVSQRWRRVAADSVLWTRACQEFFGRIPSLYASPFDVYLSFWSGRVFSNQVDETQFKGSHTRITRLLLVEGRLFSGSQWGSIKEWDLKSGECQELAHRHNATITLLEVDPEGGLVSGSSDGKVYRWKHAKQMGLYGTSIFSSDSLGFLVQGGRIRRVPEMGSYIYTNMRGSAITTISRRNRDNLEFVAECAGTACVTVIAAHRHTLFTAHKDKRVRLWDAETGEAKGVFKKHSSAVSSLVFWEGYAISGGLDKRVHIWNIETLKCVRTLKCPSFVMAVVMTAAGDLFVGMSNGMLAKYTFTMEARPSMWKRVFGCCWGGGSSSPEALSAEAERAEVAKAVVED